MSGKHGLEARLVVAPQATGQGLPREAIDQGLVDVAQIVLGQRDARFRRDDLGAPEAEGVGKGHRPGPQSLARGAGILPA